MHQKDLKLSKDQVKFLENSIQCLNNNNIKYLVCIFLKICTDLNKINKILQSDSSKLHLSWSESDELLSSYSDILLEMTESDNKKNVLETLTLLVNFDYWQYEFTVDLEKIGEKEIKFTLRILENLCVDMKKYLGQYLEKTFKAFQILNPRLRNLPKMMNLVHFLLKKFWRCYNPEDYNKLLEEYKTMMKLTNEELGLQNQIELHEVKDFDSEKFWIEKLKMKSISNLAQFARNILIIPYSNVFIERIFSQINLIKTDLRNQLDVKTVSSIMKIKSFYQNETKDFLFEPNEDHYKHRIIVT